MSKLYELKKMNDLRELWRAKAQGKESWEYAKKTTSEKREIERQKQQEALANANRRKQEDEDRLAQLKENQ